MTTEEHHAQLHRCLHRAYRASMEEPEPQLSFVLLCILEAHARRHSRWLELAIAEAVGLGDPEEIRNPVVIHGPAAMVLLAIQGCIDSMEAVDGQCSVIDAAVGLLRHLFFLRAVGDWVRIGALADAWVRLISPAAKSFDEVFPGIKEARRAAMRENMN